MTPTEMRTLGTATGSTNGTATTRVADAKPRVAVRIEKSSSPKIRPDDSGLVFGRVFTDHMAIAEWTEGDGWTDARVVPYGNFSLDPAAAVFH